MRKKITLAVKGKNEDMKGVKNLPLLRAEKDNFLKLAMNFQIKGKRKKENM